MVLRDDTVFERGKITQMSLKKRCEYLDKAMSVTHVYFANNEHLAALIKTCLERFFADVDEKREPTPFIANDSQRNIIESIRINSAYSKDGITDYDLSGYIAAKSAADEAENLRKAELQKITETAKKENTSRFRSSDGATGSFSASGAFL